MKNIRLLHISDTHGCHEQMVIPFTPYDIDAVVHTGDATNYRDYRNEQEFYDFVRWYATEVSAQNKIYVAGNHDYYIYHNERKARRIFEEHGIIYLNKEFVEINGFKIYGEPITPRFGAWSFMAERSKMIKHWEAIPNDIDILATHGSRKGILDLTKNYNGLIEMVGCKALGTFLDRGEHNIKAVLHGHIHNGQGIINTGTRNYNGIIYSNASAVEDGYIEEKGIIHNGNIIEL